MRVLVIVNPRATSVTPAVRDLVSTALRAEHTVAVRVTTHPDHARELAAESARDGVDAVVTVGGDGTVNEAVQGLLGPTPGSSPPRAPVLAPLPAGGANVFARDLGLPRDVRGALRVTLAALRTGAQRHVGLAHLQGDGPGGDVSRWMTFNAGVGLDAEVVAEVERRRQLGARTTPALWARAAAHTYRRTNRRVPQLTITANGRTSVPVFAVLVSNASPWTFAGPLPLRPTPHASFDAHLDVLALRSLRPPQLTAAVAAALVGRVRRRGTVALRSVNQVTVRAQAPLAAQVDGESLGLLTVLRLTSAPRALLAVDPNPPL